MRPDAVLVARTSEGLDHLNTVIPYLLEDRLIVFAQGIERHDSWLAAHSYGAYTVPNYLKGKGLDITFSSNQAIHISSVQGVRFTIKIVTTKDVVKKHLETPGVHVIYSGHARYGRGPCFGPDPKPGEDWENGTKTTGLLRMGYPFITIPTKGILKHGYTADLVRETEPLTRNECHPTVRSVHWRGYTLDQLDPSGQLHKYVKQPVVPGEKFWGYKAWLGGHAGPHIVLHAGWENTATHPMDLGATNMRCRVFCHLGCSTFKHNYPIVRKRKKWTRTETDHFAYWATAPSNYAVARMWLHRVLTYPVFNAFESWKGSLDYALKKTNQDLRRAGKAYQLI